jgi:hypothetical protein
MINNELVVALLACILAVDIVCTVLLLVFIQTKKIQDRFLQSTLNTINELVLASIAYQTTREVSVGAGSAMLQKMAELRRSSSPVVEPQAVEKTQTGVTVKVGQNK